MEKTKPIVYDLFNEHVLAIDPTESGHIIQETITFLSRNLLSVRITGNSSSTSHGVTGFPYQHTSFSINTEEELNLPKILIVPYTFKATGAKGMHLVLYSKDELTDVDLRLWKNAIVHSINAVTKDHDYYSWTAIIQQNNTGIKNHSYALKKSASFGKTTIRSGGRKGKVPYKMAQSMVVYSQNPGIYVENWPIIIEGQNRACNETSALEPAMVTVHKIMALISLAWDSSWVLAQAPMNMKPGAMKQVPKVPKNQGLVQASKKVYRYVPIWALNKFEKIDSNEEIRGALTAYHEATKLAYDNHPSYALLAYVSIIETIGKSIIGHKCLTCGREYGNSHNKRAFMQGVKSVYNKQQDILALEDIYNLRHETAHTGKLHADEVNEGAFIMPKNFSVPSSLKFIYIDLEKLKKTAQLCLIKAIKQL